MDNRQIARVLHEIADLLDIKGADGRFRTLPGMKEKKEARIRRGLEHKERAEMTV